MLQLDEDDETSGGGSFFFENDQNPKVSITAASIGASDLLDASSK